MRLARDLGLTLEQALQMSTLELRMWAVFYNLENKDREKRRKHGNGRRNRR